MLSIQIVGPLAALPVLVDCLAESKPVCCNRGVELVQVAFLQKALHVVAARVESDRRAIRAQVPTMRSSGKVHLQPPALFLSTFPATKMNKIAYKGPYLHPYFLQPERVSCTLPQAVLIVGT